MVFNGEMALTLAFLEINSRLIKFPPLLASFFELANFLAEHSHVLLMLLGNQLSTAITSNGEIGRANRFIFISDSLCTGFAQPRVGLFGKHDPTMRNMHLAVRGEQIQKVISRRIDRLFGEAVP